jgi:rubrerythrin
LLFWKTEQNLVGLYVKTEGEKMKSLKGTKTEQNLLKSFAGESQARNRYTYFASAAKKEGFEQIAAIFTETADNEKEHAKRFFKFLEAEIWKLPQRILQVKSELRLKIS